MDTKKSVQEALNEFERLEENVNEYGWIVDDQDDCLDPWNNQQDLEEGISQQDWSSITPCDIVFCNPEVQHRGETPKRRPVVVVYKSSAYKSPILYGMQVTTVAPGNSFRSKFKSEIKDWNLIGLNKPSYINYDHLVRNLDDDIRTRGQAWLTKRDAKTLLSNIERDYDDLILYGYSMPQDKRLLDGFIEYLRKI